MNSFEEIAVAAYYIYFKCREEPAGVTADQVFYKEKCNAYITWNDYWDSQPPVSGESEMDCCLLMRKHGKWITGYLGSSKDAMSIIMELPRHNSSLLKWRNG